MTHRWSLASKSAKKPRKYSTRWHDDAADGMKLQDELRAAYADVNSGNFRRAEKTLAKLAKANPGAADPHVLMGLCAYRQGKTKPSERHLRRAIEIAPDRGDLRVRLAELLLESSEGEAALEQAQSALTLSPSNLAALRIAAKAQSMAGRFEEAVLLLQRALPLAPNDASISYELGLAETRLGRDEDAASHFDAAAKADPANAAALSQRGSSLIRLGRILEAEAVFKQAAKVASNPNRAGGVELSPAVLRHEVEQIDYLNKVGLATDEDLSFRQKVAELLCNPDDQSAIDSDFIRHYAAIDHRGLGNMPDGDFLNPEIDPDRVQAEYFAGDRSCIALDNVLAPGALDALRRFCLGARIWKKPYVAGYLGAGLGEGFGCELVLNLSETLRTTFPKIFGDHRLRQAWGFKYENVGKGVNVHADIGVVNVNFWITPSEANRDPEGGGLTVFDAPAPRDWNFSDYNTDTKKIRRFLKDSGANAIRIPHRGNRAAIFDSTLFHETHDIDFHPGYENRRINVTFVYGRGMPK